MKKTLHILGFFTALNLSLFNLTNVLAGALTFEVPDNPEPITETITYQCETKTGKERVQATYLNTGNISLVDFRWQGDRVIAANVIATTGKKYAGAQYIWWENNKEIILYDLIYDPEKQNPILCKDETTLLF
ncbi:MliC family protein [Bartonella rattaustraliani]|uniref:MliC family protein n=1 Tax=Bartonella rattaustraliani TaxID=481139 RepID=UPI0003019091|nr:MliC family protein [Bartonella rattaustraliani]